MQRRAVLLGLGAALAAPAVVKAESLMPLWVPRRPGLWISIEPSRFMIFRDEWEREAAISMQRIAVESVADLVAEIRAPMFAASVGKFYHRRPRHAFAGAAPCFSGP